MLELPGDGGCTTAVSVLVTVNVPGIPAGTVFVPGSAGAHVPWLTTVVQRLRTSHVTHARELIITFELIHVTFFLKFLISYVYKSCFLNAVIQ